MAPKLIVNDRFDTPVTASIVGYSSTSSTTVTMVDQYPTMEPLISQQQSDSNNTVDNAAIHRRKSFIRTFVTTNGPPQIVIVCILLALGFGSTIGVVPAVMTDRYAVLRHNYNDTTRPCSSYTSTNTMKPQACYDASADAQNGVAIEQMLSNTFTFLTSSYVGAFSDVHGRKGVMITGIFVNSLSPLLLVLLQLQSNMSPFWYYTAGAISGFVSWIGVALSTLSDVMPPEWRAPSYGLVLVGFSFGFALAPQLAFFFGHFYVSVLSLCTIWLGLFILIFFLPETLPSDVAHEAQLVRDEQMNMHTTTVTQRVIYSIFYRPFWELSILNRSRLFRLLSCLAFFSGMVSSGDRTLLVYYIEERLNFNDKDIATLFLIAGVLGILVQGFGLKILNDYVGERNVVIIAFVFGAVNNIIYAFSSNKAMLLFGVAVGSLVGMSFPTISAIKSNNVEASEQGRIQGALYSLSALASAFGPIAMRFVYQFTKDGALFGPGTMFLFATMLYIIAVYCAYLLPDEANSKGNGNRSNVEFDDVISSDDHRPAVSASTPLLRDL